MNQKSGFSLVELLVVMIIMTILASIAFGIFEQYRQKANDSYASSALRHAATAQEVQFVNSATYLSCTDRNDCESKLPGLTGTPLEVDLSLDGFSDHFTGTSLSSKGTGTTFRWNSLNTSEIIQ